jgi:pimeloyl-ACP methyl ester carboxylesterase
MNRAMTETRYQTRFQTLPAKDGQVRRIAHRFTPGKGPALVFLPGYMSDMAGSKDYSGCGESDGEFKDGTLSRWREEVLAVAETHCTGPLLFIGSSMGGWMMLLCALAIPAERRAGIIGIAPAPDFTEWGYSEADKARLAAGEIVYEANAYGPDPTPTWPGLWADGQTHLLLGKEIPLDCPARLLHGQADPDVPWETSLRLAAALHSADVQVTLIKDGDHRLSRPGDIALLLRTVAELTGAD